MNLKNIKFITTILGINSFINSFAGSIMVIQPLLSNGSSLKINFSAFVLTRVLAEGLGYFLKIFVGYISDKVNNRKSFIIMGYLPVPIIKFLLFLITYYSNIGSLAVYIYIVCNLVDKLFNVFRDGPRDSLILDECEQSEIQSNLMLRKVLSTLGNTLGIIIFFCLNEFFNVSVSSIFLISCLLSVASFIFLLCFIRESKNKTQNISNNYQNSDILKDLWTTVSNNKSTVGMVLLSSAVMFMGKLDDFFIVKVVQNSGFIYRMAATLLFPLASTIFGILNYKNKKSNTLLIILNNIFTFCNLIFYVLYYKNNKIYTYLYLFFIIVHGSYRSIIDSVLINNLVRDVNNKHINGTIIGILNFMITMGILSRTVVGKLVSRPSVVLFSIIASLMGGLLFTIYTYNKKSITQSNENSDK